jgi:hypothetical protein
MNIECRRIRRGLRILHTEDQWNNNNYLSCWLLFRMDFIVEMIEPDVLTDSIGRLLSCSATQIQKNGINIFFTNTCYIMIHVESVILTLCLFDILCINCVTWMIYNDHEWSVNSGLKCRLKIRWTFLQQYWLHFVEIYSISENLLCSMNALQWRSTVGQDISFMHSIIEYSRISKNNQIRCFHCLYEKIVIVQCIRDTQERYIYFVHTVNIYCDSCRIGHIDCITIRHCVCVVLLKWSEMYVNRVSTAA